MLKPNQYYAHGKLLITGEYVVLDGATALAAPTSLGQRLEVTRNSDLNVTWKSYLRSGDLWIDEVFEFPFLSDIKDGQERKRMFQIMEGLRCLLGNEAALTGSQFKFNLEFGRRWGLGSSSTLLSLLAQVYDVNPYALLEKTFKGSGYDIACATATSPILYTRNTFTPKIEETHWNPSFKDSIFFVWLNEKQNSRNSIRKYRNLDQPPTQDEIDSFSELSIGFSRANKLETLQDLILEHEDRLSVILDLEPVKIRLFPDYPGCVKSLGGWGGDFVMCTGSIEDRGYFEKKGYKTIFGFDELIVTA